MSDALFSEDELPNTPYQVLARKYRPRTFADLIGQEAMVKTLTNAFARGRIAHAFMMTGVRGVGKTTTARLLARAFNYEADGVDSPSMDLATPGRHCAEIIDGRHMDVLEMDAASRTKVEDMRELLDGVRYAPVSARYKIYIIDEVHMLSDKAFNALLKTLEEPPPHAKFIFATTEIRKVPITILSRCQRFDLKRVTPDQLVSHLSKICTTEGITVDADGLALIARAAEGSVRDALSLLDQALVQGEGQAAVSLDEVRQMLGLADRGRTLDILEHVMAGRVAEALQTFADLYVDGADPQTVMRDLLDHTHAMGLVKMLGSDAVQAGADEKDRLAELGAVLGAGLLSRMWQMLLKAYDEVRLSPDAKSAVEMVLIRLAHAVDLPGPEEALKLLQAGATPPAPRGPSTPPPSGGGGGRASVAMPSAAPQGQTTPAVTCFLDVVDLISQKRDIRLRHDVETYVRLAAFRPGHMEFALAEGGPGDLPQRLSQRLQEWTGETWLISTVAEGGETLAEERARQKATTEAQVRAHPALKPVFATFPEAKILSVYTTPTSADGHSIDDEETDR